MFDPEPFTVEEGTDERFAAITIHVERVGYSRIVDSIDPATVRSRSDIEIDGRDAVRIERTSSDDVIIPPGTDITSYFIDLGDSDGTLVADTLDLSSIDYERARDVLDQMVDTIEITR